MIFHDVHSRFGNLEVNSADTNEAVTEVHIE